MVVELVKEEKMCHKKYPYWAMPWYEEDVVHYTSRGQYPITPSRYQSCYLNGRKYKSFISQKNAEIALMTKYKEDKGYSHFIRLSVDSTYFVVFQFIEGVNDPSLLYTPSSKSASLSKRFVPSLWNFEKSTSTNSEIL